MFSNYISRIARTDWGKYGTGLLAGIDPANVDNATLYAAIVGLASGLQQAMEEIATLGAKSQSYDAYAPVNIQVSPLAAGDRGLPGRAVPTRSLPPTCGDHYSALWASNWDSYLRANSDGTLSAVNGFAGVFCGPVSIQKNTQREFGPTVNYSDYVLNVGGSTRITSDLKLSVNSSIYFGNRRYTSNTFYTSNDGKLKITNADSRTFLHTKWKDVRNYNTHSLLAFQTSTDAGTRHRIGIAAEIVTGYSGTGKYSLCIDNGAWTFIGITACTN